MFDKLAAFQEIEQRNRLRAQAHLPPVSLDELRRAEQLSIRKEYEAEFRKFLKTQGSNKGEGLFGKMAWQAMKEKEFQGRFRTESP